MMNKVACIGVSAYLLSLSKTNAFTTVSSSIKGEIIPFQRSQTRLYMFDFLKPKESPEEEENPIVKEEKQEYSPEDPVEKIFGFFFGEKEEEPMGMKRFGRGVYASRASTIL